MSNTAPVEVVTNLSDAAVDRLARALRERVSKGGRKPIAELRDRERRYWRRVARSLVTDLAKYGVGILVTPESVHEKNTRA